MTGRLLCLDVGDVRIGIALSDERRIIATPHSVYTRVGWGPDTRFIQNLMQETGAAAIVCGLPLNMDGSEGFQAQKVRAFAEQLRKAGMEVIFQDERLTTVSAHEVLIEGGMRREERKHNVDKVAAAFILQSYLDGET
ncbi:MAG: Holliday junction resolvase RuvX [Clostridiales bacterium]|nr:Holliday junction resolvase RuvX [Clostridiales bacterium]